MRDRFGREIDYMRISVIDSCNLNCYYCNPQDNNKNCQAINILSVKKVLCIVRAATRLGITHFRLTGGEPLLHPQIDEMVSQIKKIHGVRSVSLTTNAVLLAQHAKQLKEAGIDSINVSLDTIDASEYEHITKKPLLYKVEHGIDAAIECGIRVKINVVGLMKDRVSFIKDLWGTCKFFFVAPMEYDEKTTKKRWKEDSPERMLELADVLEALDDFSLENQEKVVMKWIEDKGYHLGNIMNAFRLTLVGEGKGPHMFDISAVLGKEETLRRIRRAVEVLK